MNCPSTRRWNEGEKRASGRAEVREVVQELLCVAYRDPFVCRERGRKECSANIIFRLGCTGIFARRQSFAAVGHEGGDINLPFTLVGSGEKLM